MNRALMQIGFRMASVGVLVVVIGLMGGCGAKKGKGANLSGKITYPTEDKPVTGGTINLYSTSSKDKTQPLKYNINADGTYSMVDVPVGEWKVTVETESIKGSVGGASPYKTASGAPAKLPDNMQIDTSKIPTYRQIPQKYGNEATTPLTLTTAEGKQEKNFNLTD